MSPSSSKYIFDNSGWKGLALKVGCHAIPKANVFCGILKMAFPETMTPSKISFLPNGIQEFGKPRQVGRQIVFTGRKCFDYFEMIAVGVNQYRPFHGASANSV